MTLTSPSPSAQPARILIIGGGTVSHVRNHLALSAPAYGETARTLFELFSSHLQSQGLQDRYNPELILTRMADPQHSRIETHEDIAALVDEWIVDPTVKGIVFNVALVDFHGQIGEEPSGKHATRLQSRGPAPTLTLTPYDKLIGRLRQHRKDLFVAGFKTTCHATSDEQYRKGLELLKSNSLNLVVANDTGTRMNMIVTPEESRYHPSTDRRSTLDFMVQMFLSRMQNRFTRSTVVDGQAVPWTSPHVPDSLRTVVDHCIAQGAYKPVLGKTAGHFAVKVDDSTLLTSIRKTNFNQLQDIGLVKVQSQGPDSVIAHGFRPSVGGQSQRIIFQEHPDLDCIVHFHCPPLPEQAPHLSTRPQWPNECGSHQCGQNTSDGLAPVDLGAGHSLHVVYLDQHGPNIVFHRDTPAHKVIDFIDRHFDLSAKTGGLAGADTVSSPSASLQH